MWAGLTRCFRWVTECFRWVGEFVAYLGKLRPRWDAGDGPLTPPARPSPRSYTLALPRRMRCSATANVSRPKPFERSGRRRPRGRGRRTRPPLPAGDGGANTRQSCLPPAGARHHGLPGPVAGAFDDERLRAGLAESSRRLGARGAQNSPRREAGGPSQMHEALKVGNG